MRAYWYDNKPVSDVYFRFLFVFVIFRLMLVFGFPLFLFNVEEAQSGRSSTFPFLSTIG